MSRGTTGVQIIVF